MSPQNALVGLPVYDCLKVLLCWLLWLAWYDSFLALSLYSRFFIAD
jgi:hypothetical protein